jgi:hypothetical protein
MRLKTQRLSSVNSAKKFKLGETVELVYQLLRRRHPADLRKNRRQLRDKFFCELRARFRLPPGRPRSKELDRIERERKRGHTLPTAISLACPAFRTMDATERSAYMSRAKRALRNRTVRREAKKKRKPEKSATDADSHSESTN